MSEIMNHPWITKGAGGPPDNFLPTRRPLQIPLDRNVIRKMDGFDFGSPNSIEDQLTRIVESEEYQRAIRNHEKKSNMPTPEIEKKRGVFDFYKRRNSLSRDTLASCSSDAVQWGMDPINGFHPLVSVYYLAKEKLDREFRAANPGAVYEGTLPKTEANAPPTPQAPAAPEAAYTNPTTYEMTGEAPTGGRSRPRARTHGQEEVAQDLRHVKIDDTATTSPNPQIVTPAEQAPLKRERTAANLLRRLSTRRHRDRDRERGPERDPEKPLETPTVAVDPPQEATTSIRKSFSIRRRENSSSRTPSLAPSPTPQADRLSPALPENAARLGRSTSVNSGDFRRRLAKRQSGDPAQLWSTNQAQRQGSADHASQISESAEPEVPQSVPSASRTKSLGHARRESIQRRRQERARNKQGGDKNTDNDAQSPELDDETGLSANEGGSPGSMKPVFLKGLFSVSTTSSKPFKVIEADIVRVLRQLNIQFSSNGKGGFKCRHTSPGRAGDEAPQIATPAGLMHRRKLSFNFMGSDKEDKDQHPARTPPTSSRGKGRSTDQSDDDPMESEIDEGMTPIPESRPTLSAAARAAGETSTHVQNDLGTNTDLRFEIFVVKVPLLSLHGIQFKKVDGGTWQYKNMAQTILDGLRL